MVDSPRTIGDPFLRTSSLDLFLKRSFVIFQELSLEQINLPQTSSSGSLILSSQIDNGNQETSLPNAQQLENNSNITAPTQLGLDQGAMHEVYVSAIVSGGHVFLQVNNSLSIFVFISLST